MGLESRGRLDVDPSTQLEGSCAGGKLPSSVRASRGPWCTTTRAEEPPAGAASATIRGGASRSGPGVEKRPLECRDGGARGAPGEGSRARTSPIDDDAHRRVSGGGAGERGLHAPPYVIVRRHADLKMDAGPRVAGVAYSRTPGSIRRTRSREPSDQKRTSKEMFAQSREFPRPICSGPRRYR